MHRFARRFKKIVAAGVSCALLLSGCAVAPGSGGMAVGPAPSTTLEAQSQNAAVIDQSTRLDVIIPVFDPGLPQAQKGASGYDPDSGIWPELRRAEANRFAYKLKLALEETGVFGAVRVTPDANASGDLYLLGTIKQSDGEDVEFALRGIDTSGRQWFDTSFSHEVDSAFHRSARNRDKDPYQPAFDDAAAYVVEHLTDYSKEELRALRDITELRFAASFSAEAIAPYLKYDGDRVNLIGLPSRDDPMMQRIRAIRVRDQLFVDRLQNHYQGFSDKMQASYRVWQEQSLAEIEARRDANIASVVEGVGGVLLIGAAVLAAIAGGGSDSVMGQAAGTAGAVVGGIVGAKMLAGSFQSSEEAKVHREALAELGESIDLEMAPEVIAFEKESVNLTGDAREQFAQWRAFLARIYAAERVPDKQL